MGEPAPLDRTFHALSSPHRRAILAAVQHEQLAVGEIAGELGLSQQIVSHHLKVLRAAGLVTASQAGTRHLFAVRHDGIAAGKQFFDAFWPDRLRALKSAAEASYRADG